MAVYDLLLSRYGNIDFVMSLDVETFIRLVKRAEWKQDEERHWLLYCSVYPHFDKKSFKSFQDFYKPPKEHVSNKTSEEILNHAESILRRAGERKHGDI